MGINKGSEEDLAIRKKLMTEISKSRENFNNVIDELYEVQETKSINAVKKVIDELELFSNDIDLSETDKKSMHKLTNIDNSLLGNMKNVTKASGKIADLLVDNEELDVPREMKKIRQYITNVRNEYKKRI